MMRGPEIYGRAPTQVRWTPDGQWIYFEWLPPGTDFRDNVKPYRIRAQVGAKPEAVTPAQADSVGPLLADGEFSKDRSMKVVAYGGDLFIVDMKRSTARHLTQTAAGESNPRFSSDGSKVIYVRDGNAFSVDITNGATIQLTDIRAAAAAGATVAAGGRGAGGGGGGRGGRGGGAGGAGEGRQRRVVARRSARSGDASKPTSSNCSTRCATSHAPTRFVAPTWRHARRQRSRP